MKYILSIAAIFVALATAQDSWEMPSTPDSWERTSVENEPDRVWVESDPSIPAGCSCFSATDGLIWANNNAGNLTVDIDRDTSCKMGNPELIIDWASLDRSQWPTYDKDQTPIPYQRLYTVHDTKTGNYQCGRDGEPKKIGASEALACKEILTQACTDHVDDSICPCYSLADLVRTEDRIDTGDFVAHENTCSETAGGSYGIYQKGGGMMNCETCSVFWYTHNDADSCAFEGDIMQHTSINQLNHCRMLMATTCKKLGAPSSEPEPEPLCEDSATFTFKGIRRKDCAWAGRGNSDKRCSKNDPVTGMRVFEHCPETCGTCDA